MKLIKYILVDIIRNKIVITYAVVIALFSWAIFLLENNTSKGILSLLNILLLIIPLVSILFSTIYLYNSTEFIELLVSQPIQRKSIWNSLFMALVISLVAAWLLGAGIPLFIFAPFHQASILIVTGVLVTIVFIALAFSSAVYSRDKAKGIGVSILLWLYFTLLFDGLVLFLLFQFGDYPIEKIMIFITSLSPINLARIIMLLQLDVSALLGYTGAIFKEFFGTSKGLFLSFILLAAWAIVPYYFSLRKFQKKDL